MIDKDIFVKVKSVYGVDRVYPACDVSELLAQLVGNKTFSREHVRILREIGFVLNPSKVEVGTIL
tara:strand:- start:156 stop:350 length:195 start_codon:yes stop_codon:yes gene_type:complete